MIEVGLKHTSELTVTDAVTAIAFGSGDMPVLATPMMMALMERSTLSLCLAKNHLRLRVLRPDSRHILMPLLCSELVHI